MTQKIDCFLACQSLADVLPVVQQLRSSIRVNRIFLLVGRELADSQQPPADCTYVTTDSLTSSALMMQLARHAEAGYSLLWLKPVALSLSSTALERLHAVADLQISMDLDDGVVVNYAKFGDVLAKLN
jgi:hypothetical protein